LAADLEAAVVRNGFGVMAVHDLNENMAKKGVTLEPACRVFEVCNPHKAKMVLETSLDISTALPCRISVYEEGGKAKLATIRPTAMLAMFNRPELAPVAEEVEATMHAIMTEAAG
jgi:uncharacterized protein (DUF302 family)